MDACLGTKLLEKEKNEAGVRRRDGERESGRKAFSAFTGKNSARTSELVNESSPDPAYYPLTTLETTPISDIIVIKHLEGLPS